MGLYFNIIDVVCCTLIMFVERKMGMECRAYLNSLHYYLPIEEETHGKEDESYTSGVGEGTS
jgi:hypothetical protein